MAPLQQTTETLISEAEELTPIQQFYKDKSIFLTGATGFLGKVIIEKLLRSCDINTMYILVRNKQGKNMDIRCEELFDDAIFDTLKQEKPKFRRKIVSIGGDCVLPGLGIDSAARQVLRENVNIVFHVAATVRFDEKLKTALGINVNGSREMMLLCREIHNLQSFVHVSTAYANCNRMAIEEKVYRQTLTGENAIKLMDCLDDKTLEAITPQLISGWPNTYTYTKCLAEDLVKTMSTDLPVVIFRPAIVIPTYKEPVTGWIDNVYGPTGLVVGVGTGVLRVFRSNPDNIAEIVPVDMVCNSLLASAWDVSNNKYDEPPVYNYVASTQNPVTWRQYMEYGNENGRKIPLLKTLWYNTFTTTPSKFLFGILAFFYHTIPGFFMDCGLLASGRKPKMARLYKKIHKFCDAMGFFATRTWTFTNPNVERLWSTLDEEDQKLFFFNIADIDWNETIGCSMLGIRQYLAKEDPATIPAALKRAEWLKILHYGLLLTLYSLVMLFFYVLYRLFW
ncbi:Fatty acyl-CoA reductase wat [Pseudolycoriella hygida]|uniref:Fatty acyl-CoA reductase n=1 Tax=Pseudolycoriella hygida TaxID=35572 RepID=A0A9Q0S578_9DIPT|nr:Fatty acyl-CoA reductase wat [Pseudolycoriella hygida]